MIRFAIGNYEKLLNDFVRNWIRLLSTDKFDEAIKQIDKPNSTGVEWSATELKKVIEEYIGVGKKYSITDPNEMEGDGRPNLIIFNGLQGFAFDLALPINDEWSDFPHHLNNSK